MLTEVAATELQIRFDEHATAAQSLTKELAAIDPGAAAQIGTQFSSSLAANDAVLVSLGEQSQNEETKNTARVLSERVRAQKMLSPVPMCKCSKMQTWCLGQLLLYGHAL